LPLQILMILTNSGDVLFRPFTERLDEAAWTGISSYILPGTGSEVGLSFIIFGLLVAYSLFPREHDEGTIEFLYSLPIARWRIFAAKTLAGLTVLITSCVVLQVTDGLLQSFNPQSFEGEQWRLSTAATIALLHALFAGFILAHGVLVSFFRRFGLIPYALLWWVVLSLERFSPLFAWLNPLSFLDLEYEGQRLVVPWGEVALHGVFAAASLALAAFLWMGGAERLGQALSGLGRRTSGRLALGCGTVVILFVAIGALIAMLGPLDPPQDEARDSSFTVVTAKTRWFDVTYPSNLRARSLALVRELDELHAETRRRLGAAPGDRVALDLTEQSAHHEGITAWTTMRVGLLGEPDERRLRRTFVHELVHAFQFQESRRRLADNARVVHSFAEGSAEYISLEVLPDEAVRRGSRRVALLAWHRHRLRFEELADSERLGQRLDPHLVYAAGEGWCAALERACGEGSIGEVLRAMGRPGAPTDLAPLDFWRDTLQAAGCGLEAVLAQWERMMRDGGEAEAEFLEALPRMGGGVLSATGSTLRFRATFDREPLPAASYPQVTYLLRVRSNPGVDDASMRVFEGELEPLDGQQVVHFEVPLAALQGRRFQFQLGQRFYPRGWPHFEPWQWADRP
jgi:hypothetical protein